jgi:hypothetical protein
MTGAFAAGAMAPSPTLWSCSLRTTLTGVGSYYLMYGRDSWRGPGRLDCTGAGAGDARSESVEVSFNSLTGEFGANTNSVLYVTAAVWTLAKPEDFQTRALIIGDDGDTESADTPLTPPSLSWRFGSELTTVRATVLNDLGPSLRKSLSQGTLFIRSTVRSAR